MTQVCDRIKAALADSQKVAVFSQWTTLPNVLEIGLASSVGPGGDMRRIDGSQRLKDRDRSVKASQEDPGVKVCLVSLMAASEGLTLTAASVCILADHWFNPQVINQAVDRLHHIGQTQEVQLQHFCMKKTVKDTVVAIAEVKRGKVEALLHDPVRLMAEEDDDGPDAFKLNLETYRRLIMTGVSAEDKKLIQMAGSDAGDIGRAVSEHTVRDWHKVKAKEEPKKKAKRGKDEKKRRKKKDMKEMETTACAGAGAGSPVVEDDTRHNLPAQADKESAVLLRMN